MPYYLMDVSASDYGWNEWAKITGALFLAGSLAILAMITFIVFIPVFLGLAVVQA